MKTIQVLTFILVCSLTILQNPLAKIGDALTTKYQKKAQKEVCEQIIQKRDVYASVLVSVWAGACITNIRDRLVFDAKGDKQKLAVVDLIFSDKENEQYVKTKDWCESRAANWNLQAQPDEVITADLASHFKCKEIWEKEKQDEKSE